MSRTQIFAFKFALLVGIAFVGSACSPSEGGAAASPEQAGESAPLVAPIQEFLGLESASLSEEEFIEELIAQRRHTEELVADCMRGRGWVYTPVDPAQTFSSIGLLVGSGIGPIAGGDTQFGSNEWARKYGLGISTLAFGQSQVGPHLVGFNDASAQWHFDDPNEEYLSGLTFDEQRSYIADLEGDAIDFDESVTPEEREALLGLLEPSGCRTEASGQFDVELEIEFQFYEVFADEISAIYEQVDSDSRIVEARREFVECMSNSGHVLTESLDPWSQLQSLIEPRVAALGQISDVSSGESVDDLDEPQGLTANEMDALFEIQQDELELAEDVLGCAPSFLHNGGSLDGYIDVLVEYEQSFLKDNAEAVSEFEGLAARS